MKVSRRQMEDNKARILDEASRLFRARGFDAVTVAEVMRAAGQTHGGFYGHFASKDDLVAQTIAHALPGEPDGMGDLAGWINAYLSVVHRDDAAGGCPTAGFAGLMRQQTPQARAALGAGLAAQIDRLERALPEGDAAARRREALGRFSAMVGALVMARAVDDPALAGELLEGTRAWLEGGTEGRGSAPNQAGGQPARTRVPGST